MTRPATSCGPASILALIPARGGSKGVPRKNIRPLAGKPLIHYACDSALGSRYVGRTLVSTDCPEIAAAARAGGAEAPFLRPQQFARDDSPTLDVVRHALSWLEEHGQALPEVIVLLQPTAPLRRAADVDAALERLLQSEADAIVSVRAVEPHYNPHWQFTVEEGQLRVFTGESLADLIPRRQALTRTYVRNGAVYAFRRRCLEETGSIYGRRCLAYEMPVERSLNIDTLDDWRAAEEYFRQMHAA